jgi:hypothetical protein
MSVYVEAANKIADAWGPAITKMGKDKDVESLKALCEATVELVLQTSDGSTAAFTIGDGASVEWQDFAGLSGKDLEAEDYKETEAASMGILGNRMILETGRINQKEELYMNAVSIITISANGKVAKLESFADSLVPSVLDAAMAAEAADVVVAP